eukprot:g4232.t1
MMVSSESQGNTKWAEKKETKSIPRNPTKAGENIGFESRRFVEPMNPITAGENGFETRHYSKPKNPITAGENGFETRHYSKPKNPTTATENGFESRRFVEPMNPITAGENGFESRHFVEPKNPITAGENGFETRHYSKPQYTTNKWQESNMCHLCKETFSALTLSRHHCRKCFKSVCSSCSRCRLILSSNEGDGVSPSAPTAGGGGGISPSSPCTAPEQRVCNACAVALARTESELKEVRIVLKETQKESDTLSERLRVAQASLANARLRDAEAKEMHRASVKAFEATKAKDDAELVFLKSLMEQKDKSMKEQSETHEREMLAMRQASDERVSLVESEFASAIRDQHSRFSAQLDKKSSQEEMSPTTGSALVECKEPVDDGASRRHEREVPIVRPRSSRVPITTTQACSCSVM